MKRILLTLLCCLTVMFLSAQSASQNYLHTRKMLNSSGDSFVDRISYHDGLGRPFQQVEQHWPSSSGASTLVTQHEYDLLGRPSVSSLPLPGNSDFISPTSVATLLATHYGDSYAYSTTVYDGTSRERVTSVQGAGSAWQGKPVSTEYLTNDVSGELKCLNYKVDTLGNVSQSLWYLSGTLQVVKTTDEDGKVGYTFTDKQGRTVLERRLNGSEMLDTYYVYDDYGNLGCVLPPAIGGIMPSRNGDYISADSLNLYAYLYRYNERNLCYWKKLPGVEPVKYVYDDHDRLAFSQDGNQRSSGKWTFYVYDSQNRLIQQGENTSNTVVASGVYMQKYYDDYDFVGTTGFTDERFTDDTSGYSNGSLTGTVMTVLGSSEKIYTAYYYDIRGRVTKKVQNNLLGGYDVTATTYTFTDHPATVTHEHTASGKTSRTEVYTYTYDYADRLSSITHKLGNNTVTLAEYTYDALGRQSSKKLHGSSTNQQMYAYNIRNWLTGISSGKFTQTLGYDSNYNGNISSMSWNANGSSHSYTFTYDGVNRLLNAIHGTGAYTEKVTDYDKNGNIKALQRYGNGLIDDLTYTYSGNQLTRVDDATGNAAGFNNGASTTNEYVYDNNGNLTKDSNKGISNIAYNCLNLPSTVTFSDGSTIAYSYAADGTKLRTVHAISGTTTQKDYCGNVVYENGVQKILLTEEGYVDLTASTPTYYYYLKDHQGNNRVVINSSGAVQETNHYYPFGSVFASTGNVQPYKYNGKELDTKKGLNWYDYGARHYDATLGRWFVVDPLAEKMYGWSPYAYCYNNPIGLIDEEGKSPISAFAKYMVKQGVKSQMKKYIKNTIQRRLEKYMSKDMMKQFIQDVDDITSTLDNTWQENLIELIPGVGDIYGAGKFGKKIADAYGKLQDLENKYVGKIYDSLEDNKELQKKFKKSMRQKGVSDARKDQKAGVDVKGEIYEKGNAIEGHHEEWVSKDPSKMTDPRNIEFLKKEEHIIKHQNGR